MSDDGRQSGGHAGCTTIEYSHRQAMLPQIKKLERENILHEKHTITNIGGIRIDRPDPLKLQ
ncbi:hypothetical protein ACFS07_18280 [Undibacterium arcticum]